ncbi:hypothetical protein [Aquisalinus flavus]|uniref:Uncharacterized protein n=1 Tax=Aquisalinus flavus TaxID=1526572 RepID=A0A8J2V1W8_9PROT|nr:hypothetical protein [Aquisalinus flavus]MBD0426824.1 hypothetical protein [Aquisalinus flavus]UNE46672.1 hypothetical protein FF099_00670 [Aquisalinus flavus]GGC96292.1 hypothetical protein GCM10011342_01370 [Aquisalinus flavus]
MTVQPTFTLDEAITAQKTLRRELNLGEETFEIPEFVGMISDEIEKLHSAGRSDTDIADIINAATGKAVTASDIAEHFSEAQAQRRPV